MNEMKGFSVTDSISNPERKVKYRALYCQKSSLKIKKIRGFFENFLSFFAFFYKVREIILTNVMRWFTIQILLFGRFFR